MKWIKETQHARYHHWYFWSLQEWLPIQRHTFMWLGRLRLNITRQYKQKNTSRTFDDIWCTLMYIESMHAHRSCPQQEYWWISAGGAILVSSPLHHHQLYPGATTALTLAFLEPFWLFAAAGLLGMLIADSATVEQCHPKQCPKNPTNLVMVGFTRREDRVHWANWANPSRQVIWPTC